MSDLIAWLRGCLDDDERKVAAMAREAKRADTAPIFQGYPPNWLAGVDIFVSPKRWQAEVDAKRKILDLAEVLLNPVPTPVGYPAAARAIKVEVEAAEEQAATALLSLLAQPYAGRDGWREEWLRTVPTPVRRTRSAP